MKKYILLIGIVFSFLLNACGQEKEQTGQDSLNIDAEIETLLQQYQAAGLAIAVIKDGKTILSKGYGYRDYENKLPVDEHTIFGIGSCTKAFTASILGLLEEEGTLKFTDRPSQYLDNLEFFNKGMNDSIQIRNLLNHTTGINSWPSESTAVLFTSPNKYDLISRIKHLKTIAGVGKEWHYNNLMYSLAGMVAENSSGKSLTQLWQEHLFTPLQMSNTYEDWQPAYKTNNFSFGYAVDSITPVRVLPEDMSVRGAGGAIYSSVSDMTKWMQLWIKKGKTNDNQILPTSYVKAATSPLVQMPQDPNDSIQNTTKFYGYGWMNWTQNGRTRIEHSGGTSGYVSNVVLFPDQQLGIVVLTNQTISSLATTVTNRILHKFFPDIPLNDPEVRYGNSHTIAAIDTPSLLSSNKKPTFLISEVTGDYTHPGFGTITVTLKGETLYAKFPLTTFRLEYEDNDTFIDHFTEDLPHVYWNFMRFQFIKDENNKPQKVSINLDQEPVTFIRSKY